MALSTPTLSAAMRAAMLAEPSISAIDGPALTAFCDALAGAIVTHITANAVVNPTALVAPSGGGPVTGAGSIA